MIFLQNWLAEKYMICYLRFSIFKLLYEQPEIFFSDTICPAIIGAWSTCYSSLGFEVRPWMVHDSLIYTDRIIDSFISKNLSFYLFSVWNTAIEIILMQNSHGQHQFQNGFASILMQRLSLSCDLLCFEEFEATKIYMRYAFGHLTSQLSSFYALKLIQLKKMSKL